jgi:hypothetical protein
MTNPHDTPEQRRLFEAHVRERYGHSVSNQEPYPGFMWKSEWDSWLACRAVNAAEIAIAERAELNAEIERLRETIREYCDDDEVSSGFGSGCYSQRQIDEIRKRHGIGVESEGVHERA